MHGPPYDNEHPTNSLIELENTDSNILQSQVLDDFTVGPQLDSVSESQLSSMADNDQNLGGLWIRMEFGGENGPTVFILSSNPLNESDFPHF
jgi:hypothetical protein